MYNNKSKSSLVKIRWFILLYIKVLSNCWNRRSRLFCVWGSSFQKSCCENYFSVEFYLKLILPLKCTITSQKAVWLKFGDLFFYTLKCFTNCWNRRSRLILRVIQLFLEKLLWKLLFCGILSKLILPLKCTITSQKAVWLKFGDLLFLYIKVLSNCRKRRSRLFCVWGSSFQKSCCENYFSVEFYRNSFHH